MTKIDEFKKLLKERLDEADKDIYSLKIDIADLFIKTHQINACEGIELLDFCEAKSDWNEIIDLMINYESVNAVKEELLLLFHFFERGLEIREVKKDKNT